jgi:signal transduction histidine kinase
MATFTSPVSSAKDEDNSFFARQMRAERLGVIWKVTIALGFAILWLALALGTDPNYKLPLDTVLIPWGLVTLASFLCSIVLMRGYVEAATWIYALGGLLALSFVLMTVKDETSLQIFPFTSLIFVYVVGLMLPASAMLVLLPLLALSLLAPPWLRGGAITLPNAGTSLALFLAFVTAFLSTQASGELYSIADWSLENYRRERDSAARLFENRQQLEKSLLRQRALTLDLETANAELAVARRTAEEASHFRGQFLANMSHELRTPLNAVIGFSETMLNFPQMYNMVELAPEYRKDLEQINNSGKHLLNIINDILDLSKIDAGRLDIELTQVDLEPIFKGVMSTAVGLVGGKPIKLTRDTPDNLPLVKGDPVRIRQVLLNIYSNAAKFTNEGSIKLTARLEGQEVIVSVTDTGEGIHPDDLPNVFEEFRQGLAGRKQARAGSGLGMAIARQLLSLMGGRIWAESTYGKGSTFFFSLPLYEQAKVVPTPETPTMAVSA